VAESKETVNIKDAYEVISILSWFKGFLFMVRVGINIIFWQSSNILEINSDIVFITSEIHVHLFMAQYFVFFSAFIQFSRFRISNFCGLSTTEDT
jgi:hypothetical protein